MKKKKLGLIIPPAILLLAFCMEEIRPYEILHSTVMSSPNLTENEITMVTETHMMLNGDRPNQYLELELYRTELHYRFGIVYDTILCNESGELVSEIEF